jgi:hypothetical protein
MSKLFLLLSLLLIGVHQSNAFADDTVKVIVATQTYQCDFTDKLNCKAINEFQQKEIMIKKNGGSVQVEDKEHGLMATMVTVLEGSNVSYGLTLCSALSCSVSTVESNSNGDIAQSMSGQYNITQKSFKVLLFFITNKLSSTNMGNKFFDSAMKRAESFTR